MCVEEADALHEVQAGADDVGVAGEGACALVDGVDHFRGLDLESGDGVAKLLEVVLGYTGSMEEDEVGVGVECLVEGEGLGPVCVGQGVEDGA